MDSEELMEGSDTREDDRLIVYSNDPNDAAKQIISQEYTDDSGNLRLLHRGATEQSFVQFGTGCFRDLADGDLEHRIMTILETAWTKKAIKDDAGNDTEIVVPFKPTPRYARDVAFCIAAHTKTLLRPPCWMHRNGEALPDPRHLLVCRNAVLDLNGPNPRNIGEPTPRLFTLHALDYSYDPGANDMSAWQRAMDGYWPDDADSIQTMGEIIGYCLTPWTAMQKGFMFIGPKRSGKGTILRLLESVVGPQNVASPTLASLSSSFGLSPLMGKLVATISDARLSGRTDIACVIETILRITGEDSVSVNRKHRDELPRERLDCRIFLASNELPQLPDSSGAIASRFIILATENSFFGKEDIALTEKIIAERPAILNWALRCRADLMKRGRFIQPVTSQDIVDELAELTSPIGTFVKQNCELGGGESYTVPCSELFAAWKSWCETNGRDKPGSMSMFSRNLRAAHPTVYVHRPREIDDDGCLQRDRKYTGIRLGINDITRNLYPS
jgi:putative DNA primase/helicase